MMKYFVSAGIFLLILSAPAFVLTKINEELPIQGIASYYHSKCEGRKTASGEIYHQDSLTAAHKTLPFGSIIKVVNLRNDSSVMVRVNDRLPKSSKRIIDVSNAAAVRLNFIRAGLTPVRLELSGN